MVGKVVYSLTTDRFIETADAILFEVAVETAIGETEVHDVLTFQDGKVVRHFTGVKFVKPKHGWFYGANLTMANSAPLAKNEVEQMVVDWYRALDVHRPLVDVLQYVSEGELEMVFPEATVRNLFEAEQMVQTWYRSFFDEVHTMQSLDTTVSPDGQRADVKLVVRWEASRWKAPAAKSERLIMDAYQTWVVMRSVASGKPVITRYVVDDLKPLPGSAPL